MLPPLEATGVKEAHQQTELTRSTGIEKIKLEKKGCSRDLALMGMFSSCCREVCADVGAVGGCLRGSIGVYISIHIYSYRFYIILQGSSETCTISLTGYGGSPGMI